MDDRLFSGGIYPDRPSLFSCRTGCAGAHSVNEWSDRISSTGMHRLLMPDIYIKTPPLHRETNISARRVKNSLE